MTCPVRAGNETGWKMASGRFTSDDLAETFDQHVADGLDQRVTNWPDQRVKQQQRRPPRAWCFCGRKIEHDGSCWVRRALARRHAVWR
jgi:hypothetical protein